MTRRSAGERKGLIALVALILITVLVTGILKSGTSVASINSDETGAPDSVITVLQSDTLLTDTLKDSKRKKPKKRNKAKKPAREHHYRSPLDEELKSR